MKRLTLTLSLLLTSALAQTTTSQTTTSQTTTSQGVTLQNAVTVALPLDAGVKTAQANLAQAQAANAATQADPSSLVVAKLNAQQGVEQSVAQLQDARLGALQSVISAYTALLEAQHSVDLQTLTVQVNQRALSIAQTKQGLGNATALDVQNAQNNLNAGQQNLAAAQAALNLASSKLATLLGQSGAVRAASVVTAPKLGRTLAELQTSSAGLSNRVSANNAVTLAQLNVKLTTNDYTPLQTQQQAQTTLANAQRNVLAGQQTGEQAVASAYQNAVNAAELQDIAQSKVSAAQKQFDQDKVRLQSGTISAVELQGSELALKQAQFSLVQAQDNVLEALAALSVASGQNVTGLNLGQ